MTEHPKNPDCLHCQIHSLIRERFEKLDLNDRTSCDAAFNDAICKIAESAVALLSEVPDRSRDAWRTQFAEAFTAAWKAYLNEQIDVEVIVVPKRLH